MPCQVQVRQQRKESGGHNTMICKKIDISVGSYQETAALYTYFLDNSPEMIPDRKRPLVLICPGGGYEMTSDREAEPVAIQYIAKGYQAAILRYSVKPAKYPLALLQLAKAVAHLREYADEYHIDTEKIVVAPADGKIVVIEEVDENEYFHDRRLMVSIFMSIVNVHANWYPVDGTIKKVAHHNGNFMKAWLPKASTENERSTVVIETPEGVEILTRQIAGAVARRIVTYAEVGEECYIDEHMGFIKFGSRVDVYLPLGTEVCVSMGQLTTGNQTVIAKLK